MASRSYGKKGRWGEVSSGTAAGIHLPSLRVIVSEMRIRATSEGEWRCQGRYHVHESLVHRQSCCARFVNHLGLSMMVSV